MVDFYPGPLDREDLDELNPYTSPRLRAAWRRGWRDWMADETASNPYAANRAQRAWRAGARAARNYLFGE